MKKLLAISGIALAGLLSAAPASAINVSFVPSATHINVGDSVTVQMNISGLGAEVLSAYDINGRYNAGVLNASSVTQFLAQFGGGSNFVGDVTFSSGDVDVTGYSLLDDAGLLALPQADAFTVLTFGFTGLANGFSFINLGADLDFERNFVGLDFATLDVDVGSICISVGTGTCDGTPVPEPGTLALLGLGILGLGMSGRRRES